MERVNGQRGISAFALTALASLFFNALLVVESTETPRRLRVLARTRPPDQCRSIKESCSSGKDTEGDDYKHLLGGCLGSSCRDGYPFALPDESLSAGLRTVGGSDRIQHLLHKLKSGQPITVVAFGGSISHGFGGCWNHDHCLAVGAADASQPARIVEESTCLRPWCKKVKERRQENRSHSWNFEDHSGMRGMVVEPGRPLYQQFLPRFMQYVNTQFPHKEHRLFNMAFPMATASFPLSCPADYMRSDADLVVMDHAVNRWSPYQVEQLLANVMRLPRNPAVLLVNMYMWNVGAMKCTRYCVVPQWPQSAGEMHMRWELPARRQSDIQAEELAQKYGLGLISMNRALMSSLTSTPFPPPPPLWPMSNLLDHRGVHPKMFGPLLPISIYAGDLMVHWLQTALSGQVSLPAISLTTRPHRAVNASVISCVGWDSLHRRPEILANFNIYGEKLGVPKHYRDTVSTTGWFFSPGPLDGPPEVRARSRPGFASVAPGATLDVKIEVDDPVYRAHVKGVTIHHVVSYTNTGMAMVSCIFGCTCTESLIDARHAEQTTADVAFKLDMMGFGTFCVLRFANVARPEVLRGEAVDASEESKFKINKISIFGDNSGEL